MLLKYSVKEIEDDIFAHEGVKVQLTHNDIISFKLYSEVYPDPLYGTATIDDLKARVNEFINNYCVYDVTITRYDKELINVYKVNPDKKCDLFISTASKNQMKDLFSRLNNELMLQGKFDVLIIHQDMSIQVFEKINII